MLAGSRAVSVAVVLGLSAGSCAKPASSGATAEPAAPIVERATIPDECPGAVAPHPRPPCCIDEKFEALRHDVAVECAAAGGVQVDVWNVGCSARCVLADGRSHGPWVGWFEDGQMAFELHFRFGERHGRRREWRENGTLIVELYYDNGRAGCWRNWDESGELTNERDCEGSGH